MQGNINTQLLDEELGRLKAIGLKELSKTTKLASSKIEDVLEKRFDKIDSVRAKGFIAILEREYNVDLRDWILSKEQLQKPDISSVAEVISKQDQEERSQKLIENAAIVREKEEERKKDLQKEREHHVIEIALKNESKSKSHAESYSWLYVILGLVFLALMGYFAYKAFMQDSPIPPTPQTSQSSSTAQNENDGGYDGVFFDATKPLDNAPTQQADKPTQNAQEVHSQDVPLESTSKDSMPQALAPQNTTTQTQETYQSSHPEQNFFFNPKPSQTDSQADSQKKPSDNILYIQAEQDLWLGVINLETGSKEQFAYKNSYEIPLNNKMLFVMGHSAFKLTLNGEEVAHGSKHPVRMYFDGSSLVDVNYTRFKQLNGGLEW